MPRVHRPPLPYRHQNKPQIYRIIINMLSIIAPLLTTQETQAGQSLALTGSQDIEHSFNLTMRIKLLLSITATHYCSKTAAFGVDFVDCFDSFVRAQHCSKFGIHKISPLLVYFTEGKIFSFRIHLLYGPPCLTASSCYYFMLRCYMIYYYSLLSCCGIYKSFFHAHSFLHKYSFTPKALPPFTLSLVNLW